MLPHTKGPVGQEDGPCYRTSERRPMQPHSNFLSGPRQNPCYRNWELPPAAGQHSLCGESRRLCCWPERPRVTDQGRASSVCAAAHILGPMLPMRRSMLPHSSGTNAAPKTAYAAAFSDLQGRDVAHAATHIGPCYRTMAHAAIYKSV